MSDGLIDFIFSYEKKIAAAVMEKRMDPGGGITGGGGSGHSRVSDPTAIQGIKLASPVVCVLIEYGAAVNGVRSSRTIKHPEKWLQVAAETRAFFESRPQGEFLRRRYEQAENWQDPCRAMRCTKSYYYAYKADVFGFAERLAIGYGIISPWQRYK